MDPAPPRSVEVARALGPMRRTLAEVRTRLGERGPLRLLLAVSGGADSMALLGLLERVARADRLELVVGHVDHGLRACAAAEAELVAATARARGHAHATTKLSIAKGSGMPARARVLRHAALLEQAGQHGARVVVLGHTASDQAETVLLNLCRGTGPGGLAGMAPFEAWSTKPELASARHLLVGGVWARPLLHLTREHTRALASALGLPFVDDASNDAIEHPRVRVRQRVLAELRELNPQVELRIAAMARTMRGEQERATASHAEHEAGVLDALALRSLPSGSRRAAVRAMCLHGGVPADALPERTIAAIDDALARGLARRSWDLHRHVLRLADARLWLDSAVLASDPAPAHTRALGPIAAAGPTFTEQSPAGPLEMGPKRSNH